MTHIFIVYTEGPLKLHGIWILLLISSRFFVSSSVCTFDSFS